MMYHKAIAFKDQEIAEKIIKEAKPRKQKSLGRQVKNFEAEKWDKQKTQVVEDGNYWKFMQPRIDEDLRKMLLETGDRLLVEVRGLLSSLDEKGIFTDRVEQASPFDRVWGIGYSAANAEGNKGNWGENLLGKALMRVRDRLRATEVSESVEKATDAKNKS